LLDPVHPLPRHRHAELEHAHQLLRKRHVPEKEHPHAGRSGGLEHAKDARRDLRSVLDLVQDPDLHVVDEERHPLGIADFFERTGDVEAIRM